MDPISSSYQNQEEVFHPIEPTKRTSRWTYVLGVLLVSSTIFLLSMKDFTFGNSIRFQTNLKQKSKTSSVTSYSKLSDNKKEALFEEFKKKFGKHYESEAIEKKKYQNFKAFLVTVDKNNEEEARLGGSAIHDINKFADMSEEEFQELYLSSYTPHKAKNEFPEHLKVYNENDEKSVEATASTYVNWAGVYSTAIEDQGYCGSCWAFSAKNQLESDSIRYGYLTVNDTLSAQQIVSCDTYAYGCEGGNTYLAYYYVYKAGGLESTDDYPYTSYYDETGSCSSNSSLFDISLTKMYYLSSELAMRIHVMNTGPLSVCLAASSWYTYSSGVLTSCTTHVNHCVQAVGLNLEASDDDEDYWIIRNSWGTDWGEDGYIYLKYGSNTCDLTYYPTYLTPEEV